MRDFRSRLPHVAFVTAVLFVTILVFRLAQNPMDDPRGIEIPQVDHGSMGELPERLTRDAGTVVAGQPIEVMFSIKNRGQRTWELDGDQAIEASCGCTRVDTAHRSLDPGDATVIKIAVDTRNKLGHVAEQVGLHWTNSDGESHRCVLIIKGHVDSCFAFDPPVLHFTKEEVSGGAVRHVRCRSDKPVDWNRVVIDGPSDYVAIERQEETDGITLTVSCLPNACTEARRGAIRLQIPSVHDDQGNPDVRVATLPVFAEAVSQLRVLPSVILFRRAASPGAWNAQVVVTGDPLEKGDSVRDITAAAGSIVHRSQRLSPRSERISISLTLSHEAESRHEAESSRTESTEAELAEAARDAAHDRLAHPRPDQLTLWMSQGGSHAIPVRYVDRTAL